MVRKKCKEYKQKQGKRRERHGVGEGVLMVKESISETVMLSVDLKEGREQTGNIWSKRVQRP